MTARSIEMSLPIFIYMTARSIEMPLPIFIYMTARSIEMSTSNIHLYDSKVY